MPTSRFDRTAPGGTDLVEGGIADSQRPAGARCRKARHRLSPGRVGRRSPDFDLVLPAYRSLLTSTVNLLVAGTEIGCRRIVLSGSFTEPVPGRTNPNPSSPYAAAKWAASGYGRMFHSLFQTPVVILRPFMVYGPAQAPSKLIPSVISSLLSGNSPRISSGKQRRTGSM